MKTDKATVARHDEDALSQIIDPTPKTFCENHHIPGKMPVFTRK
jgi:hypothetical protein